MLLTVCCPAGGISEHEMDHRSSESGEGGEIRLARQRTTDRARQRFPGVTIISPDGSNVVSVYAADIPVHIAIVW